MYVELPFRWTRIVRHLASDAKQETTAYGRHGTAELSPRVPARVGVPGTEMPWPVGREKGISGNICPAAGAIMAAAHKSCEVFHKV